MAIVGCDLTRGRGLGGCLTTVGGVKNVYFADFGDATTAATSSELNQFDGVPNVYKYAMRRGMGTYNETINASAENGTVFYTPEVGLKLSKLTKKDQNELKLIAQNTLICFVELNELNDNGKNVIMALGTDTGANISGGTNTAGAAMGDFNGYEWTFSAESSYPTWVVADYTISPLDNAGFNGGAGVTVVAV
jgi:hypothetical protein|tara:strand:+ start:11053 stop:11628 length:576 start_codon:yes stop_codon:yes gene_type:complete